MAVDSVLGGVDPTAFDASNPIRLFIIQAAILIVFSRILAVLLRKINQPPVIAEVIGGILLGPTAMGRVPGFTNHIFPTASLSYLNLVATLGLVLFLFIVGLEVDLRTVKSNIKASASISFIGMIIPFALGAAIGRGIYDQFIDSDAVSFGHFLLFSGVAMCITAFPVLARILTETKLLYTRVGVIVLAAGVGNDIVGWVLLALTVALVNAGSGVIAVYVLLCSVGWALVIFLLIKPAFVWLARRTGSFEHGPTQVMVTLTLLLVLISAWVTDIIGVHPIFGAFLIGLMVPHEGGYAVAMTEKVEDLVSVIFLPIYFGLSGLRTDLGTLNTGLAWGYAIALIVVAFFSKFGGCAGTAKACGFGWRESAAIGTLMSCKGLVELIVLNIGLSAGVLNTLTFSMFVLMAVVSTVLTTPLVLWIYPEKHRTQIGAEGTEDGSASGESGQSAKEREAGDWSSTDPLLRARRIMVVLTGFEHLPSLMNLVQLIRPSSSPASGAALRKRHTATASSGIEDKEPLVVEDLDDSLAHHKGSSSSNDDHGATALALRATTSSSSLSIDALRLVELTDRTSAVMRVAESDDTLRADPISNVFRTFASLNRVPIRASLSVIGVDHFPGTVVSKAKEKGADLVVLPWTIPRGTAGQQQPILQDAATQASNGFIAALSSPFDHIFGGTSSGTAAQASSETDAQALMRNTSQYAAFARRLIQSAECDVGLLVDRHDADHLAARDKFSVVPPGKGNHILLGFMGGPDDRVAMSLVTRFAAINEDLSVTILRMKRVPFEDSGDSPFPEMPATIHTQTHTRSLSYMQGLTIQDTVYHHTAGGNMGEASLEATLQDDLVFRALEGLMASVAGRVQVKEIATSHPLRDFILAVQDEQPSLVIVGRGRKMPTMGSHRDELRVLLTDGVVPSPTTPLSAGSGGGEGGDNIPSGSLRPLLASPTEAATRAANSETCKVVGEVAMALTRLANSSASILVVAASNKSSTARAGVGEEA